MDPARAVPTPQNAEDPEAQAPAPAAAANGTPAVPRQRGGNLSTFLFIMVMFYMFNSHGGDEFLARHQYQDALESLVEQHANFTAWMNNTNSSFSLPPEDKAFQPLVAVFQPPPPNIDPLTESFYQNITGFMNGDARFNNVSAQAVASNETIQWKDQATNFMTGVNATAMLEKIGTWRYANATNVQFNFVEKPRLEEKKVADGEALLIRGKVEVTEDVESETLRLDFEGIHFVSQGTIYGFAEPNGKQIDIRLLPSLVPEEFRNITARLVAPELQARIDKLKEIIDAGQIDDKPNASEEAPATTCPFVFQAQLDKTNLPRHVMVELENEVKHPTGVRLPPIPKLSFTGVLVSKECGILFEVVNIEGIRTPLFFRKVTTYAGFTGLCYLLIIILHARQFELSRAASNISRVSRWTFFSQATMDSVSFAGHLTFAILAEGRASLSLMVPAFLVCVLFVHEAQFAVLVQNIQGPENYTPPAAPRPPQLPAPEPAPASPAANADEAQQPLLPSYPPAPQAAPPPTPQAPTPAPAPQPTVIQAANNMEPMSFWSFLIHHLSSDQQARTLFYMVVFFSLIVRVILSTLLTMIFIAVTYSFIWLPQIVRSVRRGRSSGLTTEYVMGSTFSRLYLLLYFFACPKNVLEVDPRPWVWPLAFFILFQAFVVLLQDTLGPTFFMPQSYSHAKGYDYHPPMALPDTESPEKSLGDCAICMDAILIEAPSSRRSKSFDGRGKGWEEKGLLGSSSGASSSGTGMAKRPTRLGSILNAFHLGSRAAEARQVYSLAPCSHLFHTECLEKWLAIKNICPQCRRPLPPL